jgi:hypothetical protein
LAASARCALIHASGATIRQPVGFEGPASVNLRPWACAVAGGTMKGR